MVHMVNDYIITSNLLKELNQTFILLIPKKEDPRHLEDFRTISLYKTIYKVLTKIVANCIKPVLDNFIRPNHNDFLLGQQILDVIITTHEVIYSMERSTNPSMYLKLDI